ncbi:MAG TPA: ATP-binding cassette domain-containing protein, partial [Acetobacteraceae bacterium]
MRALSLGTAAAIAAALAAFPFVVTSPYYIHLLMVIAIYAILVLGLDIVVGYTGEVSLGHAALFGIGAYAAGMMKFQFGISTGLGVWLAIPAGIAAAALFGLVLALPALRVTGPYLAMVTLAFGTIVQILINEMVFLTNGPMGIPLRRPALFPDLVKLVNRDVQFYYLVVILLGLSVLVVNRVLKSHLGRAFEALRDSPIASDCMGVSVYRYKVYAFVISAGMAGLAGALFTYSEQYISPNTYSFELTILFLLAVTLGGRKSRLGPILGAAIIVLLPNILADIQLFRILAGMVSAAALAVLAAAWIRRAANRRQILVPAVLCAAFFPFSLMLESVTDYRLTLFGVMILFVVYYLPDGLVGFLRGRAATLLPRRAALKADASRGDVWGARPAAPTAEPLLSVEGLVMMFGGLRALNHVDLAVRAGTIHGLIGPNGSGKSTMMNVLSGIYRPTQGRVALGGQPIAGLSPAGIAGKGIARTFQNVQLFGEMTALENILVGLHHGYRSGFPGIVLGTPGYRREEQAARDRALGILEFVGLGALALEEARNL